MHGTPAAFSAVKGVDWQQKENQEDRTPDFRRPVSM
jgi:hypothetical protein